MTQAFSRKCLAVALGCLVRRPLRLHLFTNAVPLTSGTHADDLLEPLRETGYQPIDIPPDAWSIVGEDSAPAAVLPEQTFTFRRKVGPVAGWFVTYRGAYYFGQHEQFEDVLRPGDKISVSIEVSP